MRLLLATTNQGKVRELREMLGTAGADLQGLPPLDGIPEPDECGTSFRENAEIKAAYYAKLFDMPALADDSGLEVAALNGEPGIHSARFGGAGSSYADKMRLLLGRLSGVEGAERAARFVCVAALADRKGNIITTAEGICEGRIAYRPLGTNGFGYDPIFIPDGYGLTFGELPDDVKHRLSHRARAIRAILPNLRDFLAN